MKFAASSSVAALAALVASVSAGPLVKRLPSGSDPASAPRRSTLAAGLTCQSGSPPRSLTLSFSFLEQVPRSSIFRLQLDSALHNARLHSVLGLAPSLHAQRLAGQRRIHCQCRQHTLLWQRL